MSAEVQRPLLVDAQGRALPPSRPRAATVSGLSINELDAIIARERRGTRHFLDGFGRNPWVYAAINLVAQAFAQIDDAMWRPVRRGNGSIGFRELPRHPITQLLDNPNDFQTRYNFRAQWLTYLFNTGNSFIVKDSPDSRGIPRALFVFSSEHVEPIRPNFDGPVVGWRLRISRNLPQRDLDLDDVIHSRLPNPHDQSMGMSPLLPLALDLNADISRSEFDNSFFRNNATPDAVLTYKPGPLNEEARDQIRSAWDEYHKGTENSGSMAVVGGDFDLKVLGVSHSQSQFLESRKFTREEVAAVFGVPVGLLNSQEDGGLSKAELEAARLMLYDNAVIPQTKNYEAGIQEGLVEPLFPNLVYQHNLHDLPILRDDLKQKAEILGMLVDKGVPLNAAIAALDMDIDPVDGGDLGYVSGNLTPLTVLEESADMEAPENPQVAPPAQENPQIPPPEQETSEENDDDDDRMQIDVEVRDTTEEWHRITDPLLPLLPRLKNKIKRNLFDIRSEALKSSDESDPFDKKAAERTWVRTILPLSAAALQLGYEQIHRDHGDGTPTWLDGIEASGAQFEALLSELQREAEEIRFSQYDLNQELGLLIERSIDLVAQLYSDIAWTPGDMESRVKQRFAAIHSVSKQLAWSQLVWALNAGRYHAIKRLKLEMSMIPDKTGTCPVNHGSLRFPGDPSMKLMDVIGCRCSVVAEG